MVLHQRIKRVMLANKAPYYGSMMLIVYSCLLFANMSLFGTNLQRITNEFASRNVQEDASFTTDRPIDSLQELESRADAQVGEGKSLEFTLPEGGTLRVFSENKKVNIPAVLKGQKLSGNDLLLNPAFAAAHDYKIGDTIKIFDKPFTIAGFMALPNYIYPLRSETDLIYSPKSFGIAVIGNDDFNAFHKGSSFYAVKFNRNGQNLDTQRANFKTLLQSKGIRIEQWTDTGKNTRVSTVTLEIETIKLMSKAAPVGILLLTSILVGNVIGRLIGSESAIIGALYALGYRRKEIYRHYLIFPFLIAVTGGITGTVLGAALVRLNLSFMTGYFNIPLTGIHYNPTVIVVSLFLPMVFLGLSGYYVIRKELKHSPAELMKGSINKSKVNFLERALKLEKLPFTAKFKIREQLRSLPRLALLLIGCVLATMLLLYGFTIKSSMDYLLTGSLTSTYTDHFQYEYRFNHLHYEQPPAGAEPFAASIFTPKGENKPKFYISGVLPNSAMLSLKDDSGAALRLNKVIMTKPLANNLKVKQGDSVNLVRKLDGRTFSVKIDSIADTYAGKYIFMPLANYNEAFGMPKGSYSGFWSSVQLDIPEKELYSIKSMDAVDAFKEAVLPVTAMVGFLSAVAFIIGTIVIYVVTSMMVTENKTNISLMKIFGYRKKEINSLILNSSTIVVVIGYLIGIPMILVTIGGLLRWLDNSVGLTVPLRISPLYIVIGFFVIMLSYEASKRLCRKKVNEVSLSEALKSGTD